MTEFYLLTESVHDGGHPTATLSARCALVTDRQKTRHVTDYLCDDWLYCFGLSHSSKKRSVKITVLRTQGPASRNARKLFGPEGKL